MPTGMEIIKATFPVEEDQIALKEAMDAAGVDQNDLFSVWKFIEEWVADSEVIEQPNS